MAHDLGLLFNAELGKAFSVLQPIVITAERMAREGQEDALLMLPDMDHFVDEKRLDSLRRSTKIVAEQIAFRMKPEIAVRRHGDAWILEQPPFAIIDCDLIIVDCLPENRLAERNFRAG